eukprot:snap_masked-scaffold_10-processed-gene-8.20-mRNA-1 protein AED:1.00 eAED:1.00 QI:0/-1/0/0/-1/1/1/0/90
MKKLYLERLIYLYVALQKFYLKVYHIDGDCNVAGDALSGWLRQEHIGNQNDVANLHNLEVGCEDFTRMTDLWKRIDEFQLSLRNSNCVNG